MERDKYDFFKQKSKSKGSKASHSAKGQMPQTHFNPTTPFNPPASTGSISSTGMPSLPITLTSTGTTWEWHYQGYRVRNFIAGGFWMCENGSDAFWAFRDWKTQTLTDIKPLSIVPGTSGEYYVETKSKGKTNRWRVDEALNACFKGGHTSNQSTTTPSLASNAVPPQTAVANPAAAAPAPALAPGIPPQPKKQNVSLIPYQGNDYGFYFDEKFFVSKKNGLAAWMYVDWKTKTTSRVIPYNIHTNPNGSKYVSVKQEDDSYKDIDLATAVCTTFNGKPLDPNQVVKFKDGNVGNCDADNLYWG